MGFGAGCFARRSWWQRQRYSSSCCRQNGFQPQTGATYPTLPAVAQQLTEEEMIEAYVLENIRDFDVDQLAALAPEPQRHTHRSRICRKKSPSIDDLSAEELELLLKEMSDEELESLL
ncbi:MAG: hypothetical protein IPJ82_09965 [Lewinellaceae bacterium]|nr:hypothetical protein [Lewinellaceae bacterium]